MLMNEKFTWYLALATMWLPCASAFRSHMTRRRHCCPCGPACTIHKRMWKKGARNNNAIVFVVVCFFSRFCGGALSVFALLCALLYIMCLWTSLFASLEHQLILSTVYCVCVHGFLRNCRSGEALTNETPSVWQPPPLADCNRIS